MSSASITPSRRTSAMVLGGGESEARDGHGDGASLAGVASGIGSLNEAGGEGGPVIGGVGVLTDRAIGDESADVGRSRLRPSS